VAINQNSPDYVKPDHIVSFIQTVEFAEVVWPFLLLIKKVN